jgi:hypothetical protein
MEGGRNIDRLGGRERVGVDEGGGEERCAVLLLLLLLLLLMLLLLLLLLLLLYGDQAHGASDLHALSLLLLLKVAIRTI